MTLYPKSGCIAADLYLIESGLIKALLLLHCKHHKNNKVMFKTLQDKLGPGLLFAASAVGVSHLIQSTRGGAAFGSSMLFIIVFICLLKYPLFMFGAHYTGVTGNTIIDGYKKLGRWILLIIFCVYIFELPFAIAGISVVSAGILVSSLGIEANDMAVAVLLIGICLGFSALGRYRLLEQVSRLLVVIFLICIIIGTCFAVGSNVNDYSLALLPIEHNRENMLFLVALAGWMPTGVGGALGISLWIHAKNQRIGRKLSLREVLFDFNCSYAIVLVTACCFSLLGTYTLLANLYELDGNSVSFAEHLFTIFMSSFSPWMHFLIIIGANVVMLSSLPVVVDLLPRLGTSLLQGLYHEPFSKQQQSRIYLGFIFYELLTVSLILLLLFRSFTSFIDMVTSLGFLAAPIIAFLNHKVIFSGDLPAEQQPSVVLRYWNMAAICLLTLISLFYVITQITT